MRTDSVRVAHEAQAAARGWVMARMGMEYVPEARRACRSRGSAQEAHEAIRPSELRNEPRSVARFLTKDQQALYRLVWERFLASQMMPAVYDTVSADIEAGRCLFRAQGATLRFKGFTAVYEESREEEDVQPEPDPEGAMPPLEEGEVLTLLALDPKQHFTQPPPRFTEASLIKALEELGIGRPSTYASILGTIINDRGYVHRERRTLSPTELGMAGTRPMVIKQGRFGKFSACPGYPECKTTKRVTLGIACPEPGCAGQLVERRSRRGRTFFGCSAYPNCKFVVWRRPVPEPCPKCGTPFVTERALKNRVVRSCARAGCDFEREVELPVT